MGVDDADEGKDLDDEVTSDVETGKLAT